MPSPKKPVTLKIADGVMDEIESHAYSLLTAEVGGMLMGRVSGKTTHIDGFIPALSASAEQVTLTFTHDVWEDILRQAAAEFPDKNIVGWYHTHPTFGIFLSEYDLFIQENFFSNKGNVALVIDPVQGQLGWFGKSANGSVELFEEGLTVMGPKRSVEPRLEDRSERKSGARVATAAVVGLLVGGAIGGGVIASQSPPDLSSALQSARAETLDARESARELEERMEMLRQNPILLYTVREGDTLGDLVDQFYDDFPQGRYLVVAVNNLGPTEQLLPGRLLAIPSPTRVDISPLVAGEVLETIAPTPLSGIPPYAQWNPPTESDGNTAPVEGEDDQGDVQ